MAHHQHTISAPAPISAHNSCTINRRTIGAPSTLHQRTISAPSTYHQRTINAP
jgi:hypothetical protein